RARALGADRLRHHRGGVHQLRRHLPLQFAEERPGAGGGRRGHAAVAEGQPRRRSDGGSGQPHPAPARWPRRALPHRAVRALLPDAGRGPARLPAQAGRGDQRLRTAPRGRGLLNAGATRACPSNRRSERMKASITVLAGDGIGPEVTREGVRALEKVAALFGHAFTFDARDFGGIAIDNHADPLPADTLASCLAADAILLGAIGGPKWSAPDAKLRPETGLLRLRRELGVYANLRPVAVHPALADSTTLKPEVVRGVDLVFVREL